MMYIRKNIRKRLIITGIIIAMGLGLTGCTRTDENTGDAEAPTVEAEDLPAAKDPGDGKASGKNAEGDEAYGENAEDGKSSGDEGGGQNGDSSDNSQKDADISSLHYIPDTEGDLYGDIYEVGEKQFTVTEVFTDTLEDGGEVMVAKAPGAEEESPKITVVYDENTAFEKKKIWDGGASHEEKEGSAADLQKGFMAEMWGSYEGDVFHAMAIRIVEVILE